MTRRWYFGVCSLLMLSAACTQTPAPATPPSRVQVTSGPGNDFGAQYSPDGSKIVFASNKTGHSEIYVVAAIGGEPKQLTTSPGFAGGPSWSKDGASIAYASDQASTGDIWVVPATGGAARQVTTDPAPESGAVFSPDGAWIA